MRRLVAYLQGRSAACRNNDTTSVCHSVRTGIPQRSAISFLLLKYLISTYFLNLQLHASYAGDAHAAESSVDLKTTSKALTAYAEAVRHWFKERNLQVSPPKSHDNFFIPHSRQYHLKPIVNLNQYPLPLERSSRLLGVTLDTQLTLNSHFQTTVERV